MKIYTRTGDDGTTGLLGGDRVSKTDHRVEAYGSCDELNACLGLARAAASDLPENDVLLRAIDELQRLLFEIGADLATPAETRSGTSGSPVGTDDVIRLEAWIDEAEDELPPLRHFILPGGSELATRLHLARTVARRAERTLVRHDEAEQGRRGPDAEAAAPDQAAPLRLAWLNRASDLLFVLARRANHLAGAEDRIWTARASPSS